MNKIKKTNTTTNMADVSSSDDELARYGDESVPGYTPDVAKDARRAPKKEYKSKHMKTAGFVQKVMTDRWDFNMSNVRYEDAPLNANVRHDTALKEMRTHDVDSVEPANGVWYSLNKRKRWMHIAKLTDVDELSDEKRLVSTRVREYLLNIASPCDCSATKCHRRSTLNDPFPTTLDLRVTVRPPPSTTPSNADSCQRAATVLTTPSNSRSSVTTRTKWASVGVGG